MSSVVKQAKLAFFLVLGATLILLSSLIFTLVTEFYLQNRADDEEGLAGLAILIGFGLCVLGAVVAIWPLATSSGAPGRRSAIWSLLWSAVLLFSLCIWLASWNTRDAPIGATLLFFLGLPFLLSGLFTTWILAKGDSDV